MDLNREKCETQLMCLPRKRKKLNKRGVDVTEMHMSK